MKKKLTPYALCIFLIFSQGSQATSNNNTVELEDLIQKGDFSPTIPSEAALIKRYGTGSAVIKNGMLYRTYYSKPQRLWIRLAASTDPAPPERAVSEILISSIRPGKQTGILLKHDISRLRGIKIGDSTDSLRKIQGTAEPLTLAIGREKITARRFRPDPNDPNFCIDYYTKLDKVVAFAIGLDE